MAAFDFNDISSGTGNGDMNDGQNWYVGGVQQFITPTVADTATISSSNVTSGFVSGTCSAQPTNTSNVSVSASATFVHDLNALGGSFTNTTISGDGNFSGSASYNTGGTISGNATFTSSSLNGGNVNGTCTFSGAAYTSGFISGAIIATNTTFSADPGSGAATSNGCTWLGSQSRTVTGTNDIWGTSGSTTGSYGGSAISNSGSSAIVYGGQFLVPYTQTGGTVAGGRFSASFTGINATLNSSSTVLGLEGGSTCTGCTIVDANTNGSIVGNNWINCTVSGCTMTNVQFQGNVDVTGGTFTTAIQFSNITGHLNMSGFSLPNGFMDLRLSALAPAAQSSAGTPVAIFNGTNSAIGLDVLPAASDVQNGYVYGIGGNGSTGTLTGTAATTGYGG